MNGLELAISADKWQLIGGLTLNELSLNRSFVKTDKPSAGAWQLDCSKLSYIDTAGLAFLLDCIRHAKTQKLTFEIKGLPKAVKPLMEAQGVSAIINAYL